MSSGQPAVPRTKAGRRHVGRWVAALMAVLLVLLAGWHWSTTFPARHLFHADPVTQIAALGKADPDHVARAARKSGDKRISDVGIGRNAWSEALNSITFCDSGLCVNFTIETDDYSDSGSPVKDIVAPILINRSVGAYVSKRGVILDKGANTIKNLHLSEKQTCKIADHALSALLDDIADNW